MKKILLLGSTGVLGETFSKNLIKNNQLFIADNNIKMLKTLSERYNLFYSYCDVKKKSSIKNTVKLAIKKLGQIDIVIHNIAQTSEGLLKNNNKFPDFKSISLETWDNDFKINLTSAFQLSQEMDKVWNKSKKLKSFITVASIYGLKIPNPKLYINEDFYTLPSYVASKAALIAFTKWLSVFWVKKNIAVNSISPGGIKNNQSKNFIIKYQSLVPSSSMINREEVLKILEFLINNESVNFTGQNLTIDGGYTVW